MKTILRLSSFFYRLSSGPVTIAALVIFLLFTSFVLPKQAQKADAYGGDVGSPDASFFYAKADLYKMAEAYGESGRAAYIRTRWTFDVIWPLVYLFFLATSLSWTLARLPEANRWRLLNLFPALGWLFDLLENIAATTVMIRYPQPTPMIDSLTPILTLVKWFFVNGSFVVLLIACVIELWKWFRVRKL
jgi:hypothetical protein